MLIRILILGAVIALAVSLYRKWQKTNTENSSRSATAAMKKCAHCGVHLPEQDAVHVGEHYFCSEKHRLEYDKEQQRHD